MQGVPISNKGGVLMTGVTTGDAGITDGVQEQTQALTKESLAERLAALVESFSERDPGGKQLMAQLLASDPKSFGTAASGLLPKCVQSPGSRYLVHLLIKEKLVPSVLMDTAIETEDATAALRAVAEHGTNLQPVLEMALNRAMLELPSPESSLRIKRALELLAAIIAPSSWSGFQLELMAHPDPSVRAKATLLIGRSTKNVAWIGRRFMDRDARVQASAAEALWSVPESEARPLLQAASKSKHRWVAANAALGLYRLADLKTIPLLLELARRPEPAFRMSAYWAMGETLDPRFLPFLMEQFKSSHGKERLAVTCALGCIRRREKALAETPLEIRPAAARVDSTGARSIEFSLASATPLDFTRVKAIDFAVWENGTLVEEYDLKPSANASESGFIIAYRLAAGVPAGPVSLSVSSDLGAGQAEIPLQPAATP